MINDIKKRLRKILDSTDIDDRIGRAVSGYSQGVQQRQKTTPSYVSKVPQNSSLTSFVKPIANTVRNVATQQIPSFQRVVPLTQPTQNPIGFMNAARQQIGNFRTNTPQQATINVGKDVFNSAKLGANVLGGSRLLTKSTIPMLGINAGIGGTLNKLGGGSFAEGAGQGVAVSPAIRGITGITNPLIERTVSRVAPKIAPNLTRNPIGNYLTTSALRGLQNVPEGALIDATLNRRPLSAGSVALDFASGFIPGSPNARIRADVNPNAKQTAMHPEDADFVKKTLQRMLDNKDKADYDIRFRKQDEARLRDLAGHYMNKEFAKKATFQDIAQELFNRAKVDTNEKQFGLPPLGFVSNRKGFTPKGSYTNTRADQIAEKYSGKNTNIGTPEPLPWETKAQSKIDLPFAGKKRIKNRPVDLPGDKTTTDFATARASMGGGGFRGLNKTEQDAFQGWVNARNASKVEGFLKKKEFTDLDSKGIQGIFEFQSGNKTGRYGDVKKFFDTKYKELQGKGIDFNYKQDYLPQLWENTQEEVTAVFGRKLGTRPSFTLESVIKDYEEGVRAGLKPRFRNISDLAGWYEQKANKAIADKGFFDYLGKEGFVLPSSKAPQGWATIDPDRFPKYLSSIGDEKFGGSYSAPADLANVINNYLRDPQFDLLTKFANYVSRVKNVTLNFGIPGTAINMHGVNVLARHTLMGSGGNPISRWITGMKYMLNQKAADNFLDKELLKAPKAVKDGLILSAEDYVGLGKQIDNVAGQFSKKWESYFAAPLFNKMLPAMKLSSYDALVKNGMSGREAAKLVNNVYGGINWEQLGRNRDSQNLFRAMILAPDWAESTLRIGGNLAKSANPLYKSETANRYRTMMATIAASIVAHNIVNKITSGHYAYENDPGHTFELELGYTDSGEKRYFRPYGTGLDMVRLPFDIIKGLSQGDVSSIARTVRNRLSIPVGVGVGILTDVDYRGNTIGYRGTDKYGNEMPLHLRAGNVGSELFSLVGIPAFTRQLYRGATGQQGAEESLTQAFELPFRYSNTGDSAVQKQVSFVAGDKKGKDLYDFNQSLKGQRKFSDNQVQLIKASENPEQGLKDTLEVRKMKSDVSKVKKELLGKADNGVDQAHAEEKFLDNKIYYTEGGSVKFIDLSPPTKGVGIGAFANRDWNITKAREVWNNDQLSKEDKDYALKKLNVKAEDVRYDALANYTNDIKAQYLSSKSDTKEKLIENILSGRKRSIGDNVFASDGVIDAMVDEGRLTKEEAKYLKSIDYNKDGTLKTSTKKGKKITFPTPPKLKITSSSAPKTASMDLPTFKKITVKRPSKSSVKKIPVKKPNVDLRAILKKAS